MLCGYFGRIPTFFRSLFSRADKAHRINRALAPAVLFSVIYNSAEAIAKPGKVYPGTIALKSTRPTGSGDLDRGSSGYSIPGFALKPESYLAIFGTTEVVP
jgi:hypothetical protein